MSEVVDRSDASLARDAALGDRLAFEVLLHRHGPALHRYALRTCATPADAEDVVQETFVAAWRGLNRWDGRASVKTWLFAIAARKVADASRKRRAVPIDDQLLEPVASGDAGPDDHARERELLQALEAALDELPYNQRACWVLIEVEGLSQAEVASVLEMSPDAVRGTIFRARRNLTERMARWR
ncbi:sigma-70 family RNA polymerase sigma factor [Terrabacter aerolatus]|uniref:RNA polymerase sigma factor n=1 Tax=Terrabacter aerolatus TaxID=422442 RepID=A0A512CWK3_9MICO|nr:sigma-70 family RNA polymerase sigma factor [Terrabacter aerolatus]GEO28575.1 putative RNA polymerase sigma factor [Terrabacter aerolatus]